MPPTEITLETRLFGGSWAPAERAAKPAWVQIEEQLADRIASGALREGERLPAERELADALRVSRMTVRQALASLAARGLVERGVGRGTFVRGAGRRLEHDLSRVAGFTEQAEAQGLAAGAEILAAAEQPAPPHVAEALAIAPGAPVIRLERVRSGDGRAVTLEDSCLPAEPLPRTARARPRRLGLPLMRDEYGLAPVEAVERLEAVSARAHEAEALGVPKGSP